MTIDEYRAELDHLQKMYDQVKCKRCRIKLLNRMYVTRAAIINHLRREALLKDLERRGIAVEVVKRFKVEKTIDTCDRVVKAVVEVAK